jgi:carbonic anhydrase
MQADQQAGLPQAAIRSASTPDAAMKLLVEGNRRFAEARTAAKDLSPGRRETLAGGQAPFAVVVCCSDSRVPPELVFDQGLGDLFVVRVAGNVVDPVVLGSVEYAVEHLHVPLVIVLSHEDCGAVRAAVAGGTLPGEIGSVVQKIHGSVAEAASRGQTGPQAVPLVTDLNVRSSAKEILASPVVSHEVHLNKVQVVGAKYHLQSGRVEWFDHGLIP